MTRLALFYACGHFNAPIVTMLAIFSWLRAHLSAYRDRFGDFFPGEDTMKRSSCPCYRYALLQHNEMPIVT